MASFISFDITHKKTYVSIKISKIFEGTKENPIKKRNPILF